MELVVFGIHTSVRSAFAGSGVGFGVSDPAAGALAAGRLLERAWIDLNDAGMAVPDWPSTFGYWFFYPLEMWLAVWDVFLEHGHRLLGMVVGATSIALLAALWWKERRRGVAAIGAITLVAICVQGLFGGLRVVFDQVVLANIHGCSAPLVFALAGVLVVITSSAWVGRPRRVRRAAYSVRVCVGLLERKTVRLPRLRRRVIVSPAVGSNTSPR